MNKTKWLSISADTSFKRLIEVLRKGSFSEEVGQGFDLVGYSKERVEARFIERVINHFTLEDPFGRSFSYDTTKYNTNHFFIYPRDSNEYTLIVANPPRALRPLIAALSDVISSMSVSEYEVDLIDFARVFRSSFKSCRISQAKIAEVPITTAATATITISSVEDAIADFTGKFGNCGRVEKIKIEHAFNRNSCNIEASKHATFSSDENTADEFFNYLSSYFRL